MYRIIRKIPQIIANEYDIPIPYSHWFKTRLEALKWMMDRGLQGECYVVDKGKYERLGGIA